MKTICRRTSQIFLILLVLAFASEAQSLQKNLPLADGGTIEVINNFGRIEAIAGETGEYRENMSLTVSGTSKSVSEDEMILTNLKGRTRLEIKPKDEKKRIDVLLKLPPGMSLKLQTNEGEIRVSGSFASVEAKTETGTIVADVPLENVRYSFLWTASRPRFLSDVQLEKVKEKNAGKFEIKGKINQATPVSKTSNLPSETDSDNSEDAENSEEQQKTTERKKQKKDRENKPLFLGFTTARGIVLLNVNPNEVPSDLSERPLTEAAKAIIRSGDGLLMEAIRRASPKYFGEYAATLPPIKSEPRFSQKSERFSNPNSNIKKVLARVTDLNNRAVGDLTKDDFQIFEAGEEREVLAVEPTTSPFNLVLLLDVSGSVDNYVDFIRKAARAFIETASPDDKIAIIIFNEDVKKLSDFTTDKSKLSESLDTFDAGGGTAYYDALGYVLADTLRPLRGERTAIVILTDGDDNRSFLPFDALLGSIQESGALIYPLYVPSSLIAASKTQDFNNPIDTVRTKYMGLTTKAEGEGEKLAQLSGGVYYPISQLSQIQKAYDDIVLQLRTAYSITFRSNIAEISDKNTASPRLKVKVKRENTFVKLGSVIEVRNDISR
jgi:VWFA-related protein